MEAFFYAAFPWVIRQERLLRLPLWPTVAITSTVLAAASLAGVGRWELYILPPVRFLEFFVGILLALAIRRGWRVPLTLTWSAALTLAALAVLALPVQRLIGHQHGLENAVMLPCWVLLIGAAAASDLDRSPSWLRLPLLVRLGEWSFALYISHWLLLQLIAAPLEGAVNEHLLLAVAADGAFVVVATAVSAVFYICWERPLERRLRGSRMRPEAQPTSS